MYKTRELIKKERTCCFNIPYELWANVSSYVGPNDQISQRIFHRLYIWMVWLPCVSCSVWSTHLISRISTDIQANDIDKAFLPYESSDGPSSDLIWCILWYIQGNRSGVLSSFLTQDCFVGCTSEQGGKLLGTKRLTQSWVLETPFDWKTMSVQMILK